jgi:uncharacterized protein (DUF1330 family)
MAAFFIISTQIKGEISRGSYDKYIEIVKPIVEKYGGKYIVRSEKISYLNKQWNPDRVIIIEFPSKETIYECFSSFEYKKIENLRADTVISNAIIVEN